MRISEHSSVEANFSTLLDMCLTLDSRQLHQQIKPIYCKTYGLDFIFNDQKQNLLHVLAGMPRFRNWQVLLKGFLYLDLTDSFQQTALFIAVKEKNFYAIESLVNNEASPLIEDEHGINAIQYACQTNYNEAFNYMLKSYSSIRFLALNVIRIGKLCIENNSIETFKVFIRHIPERKFNSVDEDGFALIHHIVLANKLNFLKAFLRLNNDLLNPKVDINLKAKIDGKEKTPLEMATSKEIAEYLYANGGTFNKKAITPIISDVISRSSQWQVTGYSFSPTDLHKAAMEGNINAIKSYNGKKIDVVDSFQMTPLLYAISGLQPQIISVLIEKGANPNFFTGLTTAYHFAALKGNCNLFTQMFSIKPDFSILDREGRSIITCAVTNGNPEIIRTVLALNPPIDLSLVAILELVRKMDDNKASAICEALLTIDFPLNYPYETNKTLLLTALETGKVNLAKTILTKQIGKKITDYEIDPESCLIEAVVNEYDDIVKLLLDANVSPEIMNHGRPLIHDTVEHKNNVTRNALLEKNSNLSLLTDQMGNTFLHRAALTNQPNSIKVGVEEFKIDVNTKNKLGLTPLLLLIEKESNDFKENFQYLVQKGADVSIINKKQKNILHLCVENNNLKALKALIGSRKNDSEVLLTKEQISTLLNEKDCDGLTPLEFASKRSNDYKCAYIISKYVQLPIFDSKITLESLNEHESKGFSPNVYNKEGIPLLICSLLQYETDKEQTITIIQKLMKMKANPSLPDKSTKLMPIHYAIKLGSKELVQILMENGANFLVEPIITSYAHENGQEEIADLVKLPERRASAIYELLAIQDNAVPILGCIYKSPNIFGNSLGVLQYMHLVKYMHRVLTLFRKRFHKIYAELKLSTELGPFLLYFADAFLPLIGIAASYESVISSIRNSPKYSPILKNPSGHNKLSYDDALIVPTQQFTYYPELIKAIIHVMPKDHPDIPAIKKAQIKFAYIGRTINERKLIAESQKELQSINLITTIYDKTTQFSIDDILLSHGQFERKSYKPPQKDNSAKANPVVLADNLDWGLRTSQQTIGNLAITNFTPFGSSMESFLNKNKIAIYLFRHKILFGIQKNIERFKLKFSCCSSEVLWDFSKEYGPDSVMLYAPFGSLLLKLSPPKGTKVNFERNRWRSDVEKLSVIDEADNPSIGGFEYCYVSWVSASSYCVNSREFFVKCNTKTEAKDKILNELKTNGIDILCKPNPLVNFDFQTLKRNEGQESDVISDLYDE